MYCLTVNLTSSEWIRIKQCAEKQWPQECLSYAENVRRYQAVYPVRRSYVPIIFKPGQSGNPGGLECAGKAIIRCPCRRGHVHIADSFIGMLIWFA